MMMMHFNLQLMVKITVVTWYWFCSMHSYLNCISSRKVLRAIVGVNSAMYHSSVMQIRAGKRIKNWINEDYDSSTLNDAFLFESPNSNTAGLTNNVYCTEFQKLS